METALMTKDKKGITNRVILTCNWLCDTHKDAR